MRPWREADVSPRARGRRTVKPAGQLRFAFYGRFSTKEHQDPETSRRWQLECANQVIAGLGNIVVEYVDVGVSRRRSWRRRPQAALLLDAVSRGKPGFDAVVVGEYERAFCGRQAFEIAELFQQHDVGLWLPETLGAVDLADPAHRAVLIEVGARSLREVQRDRHRAIEAMSAQAQYQGRYLGGRPPYGYCLVDAGPHPNASHARWGRQQQRLAPDLATARHVRWIFARRLAGGSMTGIARDLNDRGVPCPSAYDRGRNQHRSGAGWAVTTVAAILANPRYTGRQVWNRQAVQHHDTDGVSGADQQRTRTARRDWVISDRVVHEPLVSEADFIATQAVNALDRPADGSTRTYQLVGVLRCAACDRRLESHWSYDRAWYRCRHGYSSASTTGGRAWTGSVYWREDRLLEQIPALLPAGWRQLSPEMETVAGYLRSHGLLVVCSRDAVALQPDAALSAR